ncbi:MAG TPA: peptide chain release factor N(5)-glutamine methyltransferase [Bryobacteraceae bacterium]|nr:peptide chain release factor N(5)-glutamine methyltransferase [Bryobacteraceae bacterium]
MTVQAALLEGTALLERATIPAARLTSEVLLAHATHQDRAYLYAHGDDELTERAWIHYGRYLQERLNGKPTQYITHLQEFYGREYYVNEDVLIPRPETEHLAEAAIDWISKHNVNRIVDVGTGSGAIAVTVALETGRRVNASDISIGALRVATRNRDQYGANVQFFAGDLLTAIRPRSIDLLLSNPPYVPAADAANMQQEVREWEPHVALFAGDSGLEIYQRLISQAQEALRPGGRMIVELGYQSLDGVRGMLESRWQDIDVLTDLAGWPRVLMATLRE